MCYTSTTRCSRLLSTYVIKPLNGQLSLLLVQIDLPPVYGKKDLSFIDYMGPGVISRWGTVCWHSDYAHCVQALVIEHCIA